MAHAVRRNPPKLRSSFAKTSENTTHSSADAGARLSAKASEKVFVDGAWKIELESFRFSTRSFPAVEMRKWSDWNGQCFE